MVIGLGIDLVEISRIKSSCTKYGQKFAEKILHPEELKNLPAQGSGNYAAYLASRFAAKEAAVKALGTGFIPGIWLQDMYIKRAASGQPEIIFINAALDRMQSLGASRTLLSITHGRDTAAAVVILTD